jgi:hypothetical protein
MTSKFRSRPPEKGVKVENFIAGAEKRPEEILSSTKASPFPWNQPGVRDDVLKVYNLRLPEPYLLKLKYIAERTPDSMHQFCMNVLLPAIDAKIEDLTESKG